MTGEEIYDYTQDLLHSLAISIGVGVEFMEPIVLMAKLRLQKTPEKDDGYYWQNRLLLRVHRQRTPEGTEWSFYDGEDRFITTLFQEKRKKKATA